MNNIELQQNLLFQLAGTNNCAFSIIDERESSETKWVQPAQR